MAKPLTVTFHGLVAELALDKVERSDLYGDVTIEATDPAGRPVTLLTLDGDGQTLVGSGGTAIVYLDANRRWADKSTLRRTTLDGKPLEPIPSSFNAPIDLNSMVTVEEYLGHNIRAIYALESRGDFPEPLQDALAAGTIFAFPFSYRGGVDPDTGFLLNNSAGEPFLALGRPSALEFLGFEQAAPPLEDIEEPEEADEIDFGMM